MIQTSENLVNTGDDVKDVCFLISGIYIKDCNFIQDVFGNYLRHKSKFKKP